MCLLMCTSLQNISSVAAAIIASTDDVSAPSVHRHSMPSSLHRALSTCAPLVGTRVVAVGLFQVSHPSPATCDVDLPINNTSSMGVHLHFELSVIPNQLQSFGIKENLFTQVYKNQNKMMPMIHSIA